MNENLKIRGRYFTADEINLIREINSNYYQEGRTKISKIICERLNWKQPNGWLKDRACRDVLIFLEKNQFLKLPPSKNRRRIRRRIKNKHNEKIKKIKKGNQITRLNGEIKLCFAKSNGDEKKWNSLVSNFHYLGHSVTVGRCIKYLVFDDSNILGAISFSSPAWRIESRDKILIRMGIPKERIRDCVINNSRFLILPNVNIKNLASRILSLATFQIVKDWEEYYNIKPIICETFVQSSLFRGTCYHAANWILIGKTKGYSKNGSNYYSNNESKLVFLYGLNKKIRQAIISKISIVEGYWRGKLPSY